MQIIKREFKWMIDEASHLQAIASVRNHRKGARDCVDTKSVTPRED